MGLARWIAGAVLAGSLAGAPTAAAAPTGAPAGVLRAHGGAEQAYALGLGPAEPARLIRGGRVVARRRADRQGGVLFRGVHPGSGYRIVSGRRRSEALRVLTDRAAPPSTALYRQPIRAGYGYLRVRDGTTLAIDVHLPHPVTATSLLGGGVPEDASIVRSAAPYPTLIEYSGYGYADPSGPVSGIASLANLMGFAVVDVSMRGTGCSGGAFSYFDRDEDLDAYDVIETIAHQPWVLGHKVGMLGISYGGISQLFAAATDPPALEAIAPLSPIDSSITTLYPGGDLNTGFGVWWANQRVLDARPFATTADQAYALRRIHEGDRTCRANQALHGEAVDLVHQIATHRFADPRFDDPIDPITFVHRIHAATFLACQFTDEQVGGHCPDLAEHFTGTRRAWFVFTNGTHIDSLDPGTLVRMMDFYELFVAHRRPVLELDLGRGNTQRTTLDGLMRLIGGALLERVMGIHGGSLANLPGDPVERAGSYRAALRAQLAVPRVTIGFDNGAAAGNAPGIPLPGFTVGASRYPLPGTVARSWYFAPGGALAADGGGAAGSDSFTYDSREGTVTDYHGANTSRGGLWGRAPRYDWISPTEGQAVSFVTPPLAQNTVVVGEGTVRLWVKSSAPAVDLQATITEVRPDGREVFVQNGYLRSDEPGLTPGSTPLQSTLSLRRSGLRPLSTAHWSELTIPLYAEGHAYRAGSRIRVIIGSIGGNEPVWSFADPSARGTARVTVGYDPHSAAPDSASRVVLPVVPSVRVPTPLPADCGALRGEPCRVYAPLTNDGS